MNKKRYSYYENNEDKIFEYFKNHNASGENVNELINVIISLVKKKDMFDISVRNIGFRKNGDIVFFDPIPYKSK